MATETVPMTRDDVLRGLRALAGAGDQAINHSRADYLLLCFIDDPEITAAFRAIDKWYA